MATSHPLTRSPIFSLICYINLFMGQSFTQIIGSLYQLDAEFTGANFFQGWDFFTSGDPTGGFVTYYSQSSAQLTGLINASANAPTYIGADYTNVIPVSGAGRPSVRISTQKSWTHGLFIGDFNHAPGGICGTWPAFWTLGPNWPYTGEIDILEGVNQLTQNAVSLHTNVTCTIAGDPNTETGILQGNNCAYYPATGGNGQGCGVLDSRATSYGTGFNAIGGGVYAMQWTSDYIRVWVFPRNQIPADITNLTPNPSGWGLPAANMQGNCPIDQHFQQHKIIFDNTFCGSYAGVASVWNSTVNSCATSTGYATCNAFVAAVPSAFQNAYWSINSVRVYQLQPNGTTSSATPYIASLQPTQLTASSTSTTLAPTPTTTYCPNYNFTVIQSGAFQYEIECGYNPSGADLGPPYTSYSVKSFEDCVAGCSYWNTYNASNICGAVTYKIGGACYWKRRTGTIAQDPTYNGARLIYYAYPQVTDNPDMAASTTGTTATYTPIAVTPQTYSNPTVTQSQSTLMSASPGSSIVGLGMGGSVSRSNTRNSTTFASVSPSTIISSSSIAATTAASTTTTSTSLLATPASPVPTTSLSQVALTTSAVAMTSATTFVGRTSAATSSTSASAVVIMATSSSTILANPTTSSIMSNSPPSPAGPILPTSSTNQIPPISSTAAKSSSITPQAQPTLNTIPSPIATSGTTHAQSTAPNPVTTTISTRVTAPPPPQSSTTTEPPPNNGVPPGGNGDATLTAAPTEQVTPVGQPAMVDGFRYGGCQGSSSGLQDFHQVEDSSVMSIEQCVSDCYNSAYAGIYLTTCYCGDEVDTTDSFTTFPDAECNTPCPGNPAEICGGTLSSQGGFAKRQGQGMGRSTEILLTIYENDLLVPGGEVASSSSSPPSTAMETGTSETPTPISSPPTSTTIITTSAPSSYGPSGAPPSFPAVATSTTTSTISLIFVSDAQPVTVSSTTTTASASISLEPVDGNSTTIISPGDPILVEGYLALTPVIVSTVWATVCNTCENGITELSTTITVLHCGCTQRVDLAGITVRVEPPCVPMTTAVEKCGCGEEGASSTTTLTVPYLSAISEASSSVAAAMAVWTTELDTNCPTPVVWSGQALAVSVTVSPGPQATPARSGEVPEMTNSIGPATGLHSVNKNTVSAGTPPPPLIQTVTLESTRSTIMPPVQRPPGAPAAPAAAETKSAAVGKPKVTNNIISALVGVVILLSLLESGW